VIAPTPDLLAILVLTVIVGSTAAERRGQLQDKIHSKILGAFDQGAKIARELSDAGLDRLSARVRYGAAAERRGDVEVARREYVAAANEAERDGHHGAAQRLREIAINTTGRVVPPRAALPASRSPSRHDVLDEDE
jgi:hypothetical protein